MEYRGYEVSVKSGSVFVDNAVDFDAEHTFDCGQCFRWIREEDGSYTGVARGRVVNISGRNGSIEIKNTTLEDFEDIWFDYLDLGRDYSALKANVSRDDTMRKAVAFGSGIRLLRQEPWETLVSFVISANNRIPRIKKVVASIAAAYGEEIRYAGRSWFTFPGPERLAGCSLKDLELCKAGFRCKYILETARRVASGEFDLQKLKAPDREEARSLLLQLPGVGYKVADCTLLCSGARPDVFPTDVWVKRVMEELYFKREASFKEIWRFAQDYFGEHAGIAQQYLFFYARENRIGA
jgi:N-glycosylase/DNA lyase